MSFQFMRPIWGANPRLLKSIYAAIFQPMRPMWGATSWRVHTERYGSISMYAPHVGRYKNAHGSVAALFDFNVCAPCGALREPGL